MKREKQLNHFPVALTIAGSDSGGGAGIQADLKTFAALSVHGTTVLTSVTAQNPRRVLAMEACSTAIVRKQLIAVFEELAPAAIKTGMLYSEAIISTVADFLSAHRTQLVIDPVMISTSGTTLLQGRAVRALCEKLLPQAILITPNLNEAEALLKISLKSVKDLRSAARRLYDHFGAPALIKGGHLRGEPVAVDVFWDGSEELTLSAPFVRGVKTHGTGCTYSAAITACLAKGYSLRASIAMAKEFITNAIAQGSMIRGHWVLNNFPHASAARPRTARRQSKTR